MIFSSPFHIISENYVHCFHLSLFNATIAAPEPIFRYLKDYIPIHLTLIFAVFMFPLRVLTQAHHLKPLINTLLPLLISIFYLHSGGARYDD